MAQRFRGSRRFTVAFSFAGEDRRHIQPVAEAMAGRFGRRRVLYDRFHASEFARFNLDTYLPGLYRDHSELIVVLLSPNYSQKRWCGLELRWIRQLINAPDEDRLMLLQLGNPGDLSALGILGGDGYLDISQCSSTEISDYILERLALRGVRIPDATAPTPRPAARTLWRRPTVLAALGLAALLVPLAWRAGASLRAQQQLQRGDQAFSTYNTTLERRHFADAAAAWQQAAQLDPQLPSAQARLGLLHDLKGRLPEAEAAFRRARDLEPSHTPAAAAYRISLAGVLAQQPARRAEAIQLYEADPDHPRAALDLAMLRWPQPTAMPLALDAVGSPALPAALADRADGRGDYWGFPLGSQLLTFAPGAPQRCLLAAVKATTAQLAASPTPTTSLSTTSHPLALTDCQGSRQLVLDLLCERLQLAATSNPKAAPTVRWLGCPA